MGDLKLVLYIKWLHTLTIKANGIENRTIHAIYFINLFQRHLLLLHVEANQHRRDLAVPLADVQ